MSPRAACQGGYRLCRPGDRDREPVAAGFGKFGKVSMRFKESRRRSWVKPNRVCAGSGRFENRLGAFVGEFNFRGEGGYLSVQARRAKGQISEVAPHPAAPAGA